MEDILIALLSLFGDILFELFAWWPWDWIWYGNWSDDPVNRPRSLSDNPVWTVIVINVAFGALLGWLSLFVFPSVLIKWGWLRIVLLFASPPTSGLMAYRMAQRRRQNDEMIDPTIHFWIGFCFSVGFVWTRFALAHR